MVVTFVGIIKPKSSIKLILMVKKYYDRIINNRVIRLIDHTNSVTVEYKLMTDDDSKMDFY